MEIYKKQSYKKYISWKRLRLVASNKRPWKKQPSKNQIQKNIKMLDLSLNKLKAIAKIIDIKGYKSMYKERLLSFLNESELVKESEKNFDNARIEKIKKDFNELRDWLSKPKIIEIRKDLYRIENKTIK